jgi:hypothetical protein
MKTSELIEALAQAAKPVAPMPLMRRLVPALLGGALVAFVLLLVWLGVRPLDAAVQTRSFWMKGGYTLTLAIAGLMLVADWSRPGRGASRWAWVLIGAALVMVFGMGGMQLARTPPDARMAMWLGRSWSLCPFRIAAFATPIFVALLIAMRRLAPTRLAAAGAAAGLLAGALGASVYELFCQETTAAFVATWYTLGIAACAGIGAIVGARLLRW